MMIIILYTNAMTLTVIEVIDYLIMIFIFIYINQIKDKRTILMMFLTMLPFAIIVNIDLLVYVIIFCFYIFILRNQVWRKDRNKGQLEILNLLIILLAECIIATLSSLLGLYLFKPSFNVRIGNDMVIVWFIQSLKIILLFIFTFFLHRLTGKYQLLSFGERQIIIFQLIFLLVSLYIIIEILQKLRIQGVYQSLLLLFIVVQMVFTIYQTLFHIHKAKQEQETAHMKAQLNLMSAYTKELDRHYLQIKQFRHDYLTMLAGLDYLQGKEHQPTRDYFQKMLDQATQALEQSVMRFGELANIQLTSIKVLLMTKLNEAQQKGLQLSFTCPHQLQDVGMNELAFIKLLTILSDRAIDLAMHSKNKQLAFILIATSKDLKIMINSSFDIVAIGKKVKADSHENQDSDLSGFLRQHPYIECFHVVDHDIDQITLTITKESVSG